MLALRKWSVRRARGLGWLYRRFESVMVVLEPLCRWVGYERLDAPVAFVERRVKGLFFDCKMCGRCILGATGMSCPMNCPKQMRNGPCGGVRSDGNCEVKPGMRCVWLEAVEGDARMHGGDEAAHREVNPAAHPNMMTVQPPVNFSQHNSSSWLRATREVVEKRAAVTPP